MSTSMVLGLTALGIVVLVVQTIVAIKLVYRFLQGPLEERIAAHYRSDEILMQDLRANCFGLESAGVWQVRGNGALVLTAKELHFFMFLPRRDYRVPLDAITELSLTKSHLGKATIYDLLKVRFSTKGHTDSLAWYVTDPRAWTDRIEQLKAKAPTP